MMPSSLHIVLTIHHALDPNLGAPGVTLRLADEYEAMGHHVHLVSYDDLPNVIPAGPWQSIVFPLFLVWYLTRYCARHPVDVIDASTGDAWLWALLPRSARAPLLAVRNHGLEHRYHDELVVERQRAGEATSVKHTLFTRLNLATVATSLRNGDVCLFLNREDARYAVNRLGVAASRTEVVRNGVSDVFLDRPPPAPLDPDEPLHIVYVGSYHPRKGTADLERALRRYLPDHPRTRVSFLGTGIAEQDVRSRYSAALHPQIKVVPEFENTNLPALLSDGHVMLLPSVCEGFGVALVEAMACGLAPITTRTQGPAEIVTHEHDGLLVPPRSPQAITSALERVWTHRTLLHDLRRNAHRTAQSYDWPRVARDNLRLYARHASFAEPIASAE